MTPEQRLEASWRAIQADPDTARIVDPEHRARVQRIAHNSRNRALVRLVMTAALAKLDRPDVDIRKPYTEIEGGDAYSGRSYDERYLTPFILAHGLPCNATTAFLTPALRNQNRPLTLDRNLSGRPQALYRDALQVLDDVYQGRISAGELLAETLHALYQMQQQDEQRIALLLSRLEPDTTSLSAEQIIALIQQHLAAKRSSRLPVLVVAAAYRTMAPQLGENAMPLAAHNAADSQTHALGDVEIVADGELVRVYEMKAKPVTQADVDLALQKIAAAGQLVSHYVFITTEPVAVPVSAHAEVCYERFGVEIVVLDCLAFLRHFLHIYHRRRADFLDHYQSLVLAEPASAVSQALKELWLALRQAAESDE